MRAYQEGTEEEISFCAIQTVSNVKVEITSEMEYEILAEYEKVRVEWDASPEGRAFGEKWVPLLAGGGIHEIWTLVEYEQPLATLAHHARPASPVVPGEHVRIRPRHRVPFPDPTS